MIVTDEILNEWSFRCHDGIVDLNDPKKLRILNKILDENGISLNEAIDSDAITFENFILSKYAVKGQSINGLKNLYNAINKDPQKEALFNIIESDQGKSLTSGNVSLNNIDRELFNLIMQYTSVTNGEPSELWFAIIFKGKAEGGVGDKGKKQSDIVSDISVGNEQVSLKNYTQIDTLDFGSLPSKELSELKYLFTIFSIISEEKLTSSLTRNSINSLFTKITSEEFLKIFEEFITVVKKHPNIAILQRIYNRIEPLLKASKPNIENSEDIKEIVNNFIKKINELIRSKIYKVNWWAVIKGGQQDIQNLYLLSSDEVFQKIVSTDGQLNKAIKQFKGNNLGVNGNILLLNQNPTEEKSLDEDYYD